MQNFAGEANRVSIPVLRPVGLVSRASENRANVRPEWLRLQIQRGGERVSHVLLITLIIVLSFVYSVHSTGGEVYTVSMRGYSNDNDIQINFEKSK